MKHNLPMPDDGAELLHAMEYAAKLDTLQFGADRESLLQKYGVIWMIARGYLHMDVWPSPGTPVTVSTCHRGVVRGVCYRDYDFFAEGTPIGTAVQLWVTVDVKTRSIVRADKIPVLNQSASTKTLRPAKLQMPVLEAAPALMADRVDENGHINHVDYVRLCLRALGTPLEAYDTLQVEYHRECFAHVPLPCLRAQAPGLAFVQLLTPEGLPAFDMKLEKSG